MKKLEEKMKRMSIKSQCQFAFGIVCGFLTAMALYSGAFGPAIILGCCAWLNIQMPLIITD